MPESPRERVNCGRLFERIYEALQRQAGQGPRAGSAYIPASAAMVRDLFRDDAGWVGGWQPDRAIGAGVSVPGAIVLCPHALIYGATGRRLYGGCCGHAVRGCRHLG